jgi:hypothetical protein
MPRAVFPIGGKTPTLPYRGVGALVSQGGVVLVAELPCSIWPARSQRPDVAGEVYDHTGECPRQYAGQIVNVANLSIVVGEDRYKIVGATEHTFVPHVALELLRVNAGG